MAAHSASEARDAVLCGYRTERAFDDAGREDARHLLLPFISPRDTVLDVGCGLGRLLKWAAPACREAIGLDVSAEMLKRAKPRLAALPNVRLKRLPLSLRFPLPDRSVDFAYFYHVSEHLEREDSFTILTEMRRCLRPAGRALVQFSLIDHPDNQRDFEYWARKGDAEGVRSRFYSEAEALTILRMACFHPQIRLYIPGEFAVIVTKEDRRALGEMPLVSFRGTSNSRRD
jgi:SAM-dependent methyltransferase